MNDTKSHRGGLWFAIVGVSGVIALLSGLFTLLNYSWVFFVVIPSLFFFYFFLFLVFPLSIAVFISALMKRSGLALYGSIAILLASLIERLIGGIVFESFTWQFVRLFSDFPFTDFTRFVNSAYMELDVVLALVLLTLTIVQHRRTHLSHADTPLGEVASGRSGVTVFCRTCGTRGIENQFCKGCGNKLEPPG